MAWNRIFGLFGIVVLSSCSIQQKINRTSARDLLGTPVLESAHVGVSLLNATTGKYLYNYQGDKYFVPASNTKIPTCYVAMKYLGDSVPAFKYGISTGADPVLVIQPAGDPTFLHDDFKNHSALDFLIAESEKYDHVAMLDTAWKDERWGSGWSWTDYEEAYMAERSSFPAYGNVIKAKLLPPHQRVYTNRYTGEEQSRVFATQDPLFDSLINQYALFLDARLLASDTQQFTARRDIGSNEFQLETTGETSSSLEIPFVTHNGALAQHILQTKLGKAFRPINVNADGSFGYAYTDEGRTAKIRIDEWKTLFSQHTDSMLRPLMHRSDNFFAEQSLLMVSNHLLGVMNDARVIEKILQTDFTHLPQAPRWVDGSGLSRYNLFTPQDFVFILDKMRKEFGMERIKRIFPTGGEGTLKNYYLSSSGSLYAKTGSLSGVICISGYVQTKKGTDLIFSVLVNNHHGSAGDVRKAVESFIEDIRARY